MPRPVTWTSRAADVQIAALDCMPLLPLARRARRAPSDGKVRLCEARQLRQSRIGFSLQPGKAPLHLHTPVARRQNVSVLLHEAQARTLA